MSHWLIQFWFHAVKAILPRRRPKPLPQLLSYNVEQLGAQMDRIRDDIFHCRSEDGVKMIVKLVMAARNLQLLEVSRQTADVQALSLHRGRLEAFTDLLVAIDQAMDADLYRARNKDKKTNVKTLMRSNENQRSQAVI